MARHIDADKALERLPNDLPYKGSVKRVLMQAPTADVVPKSEVKETVEKLMSATDKVICEAKQEVAREIFEEIEGCFMYGDSIYSISKIDFAELKKKYTEGR